MSLHDRVSTLADQLISDHPVPGLAWGVLIDGGLAATGGSGWADVAARLPAAPDLASRICSITKTMTGLAVMQLVEEGLADLDDPVNRHLRRFRVDHPDPDAPEVTLRHLLTHTAGIGEIHRVRDVLRPYAGLAVGAGRPVPSLRDQYGPWFRTEVPAGAKWNYANHGFAILGQVVEDVRGEPYADVLRQRVLDPLGMSHTDVGRTSRTGERHFVGYRSAVRRPVPKPARDIEVTVPATGAVFSTVDDLVRYAAELLAPGTVVQPATLAEMTRTQFTFDPRLPGRGLAFRVDPYAGHRRFGHDGAIPGWSSTLQCWPDDRVAVVALANANTPAIGAAISCFGLDAARCVIDVPAPTDELESRRVVGPDPIVAAAAPGTFKLGAGLLSSVRLWMLGGRLHVDRRADGRLYLRTRLGSYHDGIELVPVDANDPLRFDLVTRGISGSLVFVPGADGAIDTIRMTDLDGPMELFRT